MPLHAFVFGCRCCALRYPVWLPRTFWLRRCVAGWLRSPHLYFYVVATVAFTFTVVFILRLPRSAHTHVLVAVRLHVHVWLVTFGYLYPGCARAAFAFGFAQLPYRTFYLVGYRLVTVAQLLRLYTPRLFGYATLRFGYQFFCWLLRLRLVSSFSRLRVWLRWLLLPLRYARTHLAHFYPVHPFTFGCARCRTPQFTHVWLRLRTRSFYGVRQLLRALPTQFHTFACRLTACPFAFVRFEFGYLPTHLYLPSSPFYLPQLPPPSYRVTCTPGSRLRRADPSSVLPPTARSCPVPSCPVAARAPAQLHRAARLPRQFYRCALPRFPRLPFRRSRVARLPRPAAPARYPRLPRTHAHARCSRVPDCPVAFYPVTCCLTCLIPSTQLTRSSFAFPRLVKFCTRLPSYTLYPPYPRSVTLPGYVPVTFPVPRPRPCGWLPRSLLYPSSQLPRAVAVELPFTCPSYLTLPALLPCGYPRLVAHALRSVDVGCLSFDVGYARLRCGCSRSTFAFTVGSVAFGCVYVVGYVCV